MRSFRHFLLELLYCAFACPVCACPTIVHGLNFNMFVHNTQAATDFDNPLLNETGRQELRSMGRLYYDGTTRCSPFLVRPNIVAMNAHCVLNPDCSAVTSEMSFITGGRSENEKGRTIMRIDNSKTRVLTLDPRHGDNRENDIAFVTLEHPIDPAKFPPLDIGSVAQIQQTTPQFLTGNLHRAGDVNDNASVSEACSVVMYIPSSGTVLHKCSTTHRMSSSAIWVIRDGKPVVIAMHESSPAGNVSDNVDVEYRTPYSNIAIDGAKVKRALADYESGGLIDPRKSHSLCRTDD